MTANRQDGICATEHQIQARDRPGVTQKALPKHLKWTRGPIHDFTDNSDKLGEKPPIRQCQHHKGTARHLLNHWL